MSAPPELPEIVQRAFDVCRQAGYVAFCSNETGRLIAKASSTYHPAIRVVNAVELLEYFFT